MNKKELAAVMANKAGISQAQAAKALDGFIEAITDSLQDGEDVTIIGFGTFTVRERAERKGRNPRTGEEITIPAAKVPSFKAGKKLKEAVNT